MSYAYDNAGNLLSETQDGQTKTYTWDAKHKLARASTPQALVDYLYDVDGIRSAKLVNGQRTDYVVDHNTAYAQVLLEADPSGTAAYTRGLALLGQERNGASSYYHADALGSTKQLTDATGTTTDRYAYTAFGKPQSATGSTPNSYRYTGEQFDDSLGQYYLRARNYDPATGRFTARDSFAGYDDQPITQHRYIYAGNDPVMYADPSGRFSISQGMASLGVSAAVSSISRALVGASVIAGMASGMHALGLPFDQPEIVSSLLLAQPVYMRQLELIRAREEQDVMQRAREDNIQDIVYHYSNRFSVGEIYATGRMKVSQRFPGNRTMNGITRPPGAYASEIPPWMPITQKDLSRIFYNGDPTHVLTHYVALDCSEFIYVPQTPTEKYKPGIPGEYVSVTPFHLGQNRMLP